MKYFETLIPTITNSDTYFNLFLNIDIVDDIKQEYLFTHTILDGETLQDISYKYYDEPQMWWLICLINNIKDPFFDIAVSNEYLQKEAVEYATINPYFWDGSDSDLFWSSNDDELFWYEQEDFIEEYETLDEINESKRTLQILKPTFLSTVISQIIDKVQNG